MKDYNDFDKNYFDTDFIVYEKNKHTSINVSDKLFSVSKIILTIIFLPLIIIFAIFKNDLFLKIFKQIIVILYLIFFIIFIYTLFNQNVNITSNIEIIKDIPINKDRIKSF